MTELQVWAGGLAATTGSERDGIWDQGAKLLAAEGTAFRNEFAEAAAAEEVAREGGPEATGPLVSTSSPSQATTWAMRVGRPSPTT